MDDETEALNIGAIKANVWDFVTSVAVFFEGVAQAQVDAWGVIKITGVAASTERMERFEFERSAGRDIEAITKGIEE